MNTMKSDKATERDGMAVKRSPLRRGWDERKFSVSWRHCQKSEEIQRSNMNTRQGGQFYMKSQKRVFTVVIVLSHNALLGFTFLYRSVAYVMLYNIQFPILCLYGISMWANVSVPAAMCCTCFFLSSFALSYSGLFAFIIFRYSSVFLTRERKKGCRLWWV